MLTADVQECLDLHDMTIDLWPDADLCGDIMNTKSTSGFFLEVCTREKDNDESPKGMPITWGCKKQASTSTHTAEAETVSLAYALLHEALPVQALLRRVLGITVPIRVHEDNSAAKQALEKGYSPAMRQLPRTQRVSIGAIHDVLSDEELQTRIVLQPTATQKGDGFTKELNPMQFRRACDLIGYKYRNTATAK